MNFYLGESENDEQIDVEVESEKEQECTFIKSELFMRSNNLTPHSIEKPSKLELKPLPSHLMHVFLSEDNTLPIIISNKLSINQENRVCDVVSKRIKVIGWENYNIKRFSLSNVVHKLHIEDSCGAITKKESGVKFKMKDIIFSHKVCKGDFCIFYNAFELCLSNLDKVQ